MQEVGDVDVEESTRFRNGPEATKSLIDTAELLGLENNYFDLGILILYYLGLVVLS